MGWDDEPEGLRNGYARWEQAEAQSEPRLAGDLVVPVFVRLNRKVPDIASSRAEVIRRLLDRSGQRLAAFEQAYLRTELGGDPEGEHDVRTVVYRPPGQEADALWEVLHVGPPIMLSDEKMLRAPDEGQERPDRARRKAVVAVIDDAVGYLNARFHAVDGGTRIRGVWVQSSETLVADGPADAATVVQSGQTLGTSQIDRMIRDGIGEFATYVAQNDRLFRTGTHKSTNRRVGHGTHVLDIAAGANPAESDDAPLILAVQLPPAAVGETSGRRLDPFIVMGLRWVILQALEAVEDRAAGLRGLPLIVNISLGSLAGPKDGTSFLEDWLLDSMNMFERLSPVGTPIRIVAAYGNAWRTRLVARAQLAPLESTTLDWRILPDDRTPSFLELRVAKGSGKDRLPKVALTLAPPDGVTPLVLAGMPSPGAGKVLRDRGRRGLIAAVYAAREVGHDSLLIAVAPTVRDGGGALAQPGAWRLTLRNDTGRDVTVTLQVQRDDTPDGFRRRGRQSWLDHPKGHVWDAETMDYSRPAEDCPVTRAGSEVSFCGLRDARLFFVAAATDDRTRGLNPSRYSSEGSPATGRGPTLAAIADEGRVLTGLRFAGVLSGTTARLSGSSMAAPHVVRRLVEQCAAGRPMSEAPVRQKRDPSDLVAEFGLRGVKAGAYPDSRLGAGVLPAQRV